VHLGGGRGGGGGGGMKKEENEASRHEGREGRRKRMHEERGE
jgi:hypothetical protein